MRRLLILLRLRKIDLLSIPIGRRLFINYLAEYNKEGTLWNNTDIMRN